VGDPIGSGRTAGEAHDPSDRERRSGSGFGRPAIDQPALLDHQIRTTRTVRIAGRDRWPATISAIIVVFLAGMILKPWAGSGTIRPTASTAGLAAAAVPPSPSAPTGPVIEPGLREHCVDPLGWRVYSRETWNGRAIRVWRSLEPATHADGPDDPTLPETSLGPSIVDLGYCSPWSGAEVPPGTATVSAWRGPVADRAADGWTALRLDRVAPDRATILGALYGPIGDRGDPAAPGQRGWPAGRYAFALRAPDWERWWVVVIAPPDAVTPDASGRPTGSAGPRPSSPAASDVGGATVPIDRGMVRALP
jgi:hypothetical protein